jgi:tetratricopeptide (TPR) repeat protein
MTAETPLRVWLVHRGDVDLTVNGSVVQATAQEVDGGTRFSIPVASLPARVRLVAEQSGRRQTWTISLVARQAPPWQDHVASLSPVDCQTWMHSRLEAASIQERGDLTWKLAGCDLRAGDRAAGLAHMENAAQAFEATGRIFSTARARGALTSMLFGDPGQLGRIRDLLDAMPDSNDGELQWGVAFHEGLFAQRTGDLRAALDWQRRAVAAAERLGLTSLRDNALDQMAAVYTELGRFDDAEAVQRSLLGGLPDHKDPCEHSWLTVSRVGALGWILLVRAEAEGTGFSREDPTEMLEQTLVLQQTCGHAAGDQANTQVNLALAAWIHGDLEAVTSHLDLAETLQPGGDPLYSAWMADLRGRVALKRGDLGSALVSADRSLVLARIRGAPDVLFQAHAGRAEVLWADGRIEPAIQAFDQAHAVLWAGTSSVPIDAGRAQFLRARQRITERYVSLLLEQGRALDAMAVVRRARSNVLRTAQLSHRVASFSPTERKQWQDALTRYAGIRDEQKASAAGSWQLSAVELTALEPQRQAREDRAREALDGVLAVLKERDDTVQLRSPGPGEVLLAWFPVDGQWVGFAATDQTVESALVGLLPDNPTALGRVLLSPFSELLAEADQVTMLPWGPLRQVDLHALPLRDQALIANVRVVYSLDLRDTHRPTLGDRWLVVADPTGDLPHARTEGQRVAGATQTLIGQQATLARVLAELPQASRFHYAGHAEYFADDALGAGLVLADGALRIGDVLSLPAVPQQVVLSACESGRTSGSDVETWGLAQAFITAGAVEVVATLRPIEDTAGAALSAALYAQDSGLSLAVRLQVALVELRGGEDADWDSYRVWVR